MEKFKRKKVKVHCPTCWKSFVLDPASKYLVTLEHHFLDRTEIEYMDAVDCPHCGCQITLEQRLPKDTRKENKTMSKFVTCDKCKRVFWGQPNLRVETQGMLAAEKYHLCPKCAEQLRAFLHQNPTREADKE